MKTEPCPKCGDHNFMRYDNGSGFCFTCKSAETEMENTMTCIDYRITALSKRGLKQETCERWQYGVGEYLGKLVHVANWMDASKPVVQHIRDNGKRFTVIGDSSKLGLYGKWIADGKPLARLIITKGEIDCLTVSQIMPDVAVISVPQGLPTAVATIKHDLEWIEKFDKVVLAFGSSEEAVKVTAEVAALLSPTKVRVAHMTGEDPNAMLLSGETRELYDAIQSARTQMPDGIINGADMWELVSTPSPISKQPYPWAGLTKVTRGLRRGELVTVTAGSGIGKSAFVSEIAYSLLKKGERVGMLMLEESKQRSAYRLIGLELNFPIHLYPERATPEYVKDAFDATLGTGNCFFYEHFGSTAIDNLMAKLRFMAKGLNVDWIILDHLSIVVSGLNDKDERKLIDMAMTLMRTLVEETGIGLILVSHLKRPEGRGHEDGAQTSLAQLRGSAAIGQLSDIVIGLERNQQGENPDQTTARVLKNRFSGETGVACVLDYNKKTGRLVDGADPLPFPVDDDITTQYSWEI